MLAKSFIDMCVWFPSFGSVVIIVPVILIEREILRRSDTLLVGS